MMALWKCHHQKYYILLWGIHGCVYQISWQSIHCQPPGGTRGKSSGFNVWKPQTSVPNMVPIHPVDVEILYFTGEVKTLICWWCCKKSQYASLGIMNVCQNFMAIHPVVESGQQPTVITILSLHLPVLLLRMNPSIR